MSHFYWETAPKLVVPTEQGPLRGLVIDGMHRFLGIPFAAPPIGRRRWRPPEAAEGWTFPRDAFAFGPVCAQNGRSLPGFGYSSNTEDCLYLNVYAPQGVDASSKLPVMVWIPGGGFVMGGSNDYNPASLVKDGNVIFVSANYRLNLFGFFSHPAINAEDHASSNYGLMDQQAALLWVSRNIAQFGGDPDNVTIFGESAGGISVWCHLTSPGSSRLFHKAIVQSGSAAPMLRTPLASDMEELGLTIGRDLGLSEQTADALRQVAATDLLAVNLLPEGTFGSSRYYFGNTVDGVVTTEPLVEAFTRGRFERVPIMNGTTSDEFNWFLGMIELSAGRPISADLYPDFTRNAFRFLPRALIGRSISDDVIPRIMAAYPLGDYDSPSAAFAAAMTDCNFAARGNRQVNRVLRQYVEDVYAFEFDAPHSSTPWPAISFAYGSCHTKELQYLFPGFSGGGGFPARFEAADAKLSADMVQYWSTFARRGTPNAEQRTGAAWNPVDPQRCNVMRLTMPECAETEDFGARHKCDFWDSVGG